MARPRDKPGANARVVVVEDDEDMRLFLKDVLHGSNDFICDVCFSNTAEALAEIPHLHPDLVLMDIRMPGVNGIECTKRLMRLMPNLKIIMVTGSHDADSMNNAKRAGAADYLIKPITAAQCLATLKFAVSGETGSSPLLSPRENEVMQCLAKGLLYKEVATKLRISESAVHSHQHKIYVKLGVSNRTEAIRKWRGDRS